MTALRSLALLRLHCTSVWFCPSLALTDASWLFISGSVMHQIQSKRFYILLLKSIISSCFTFLRFVHHSINDGNDTIIFFFTWNCSNQCSSNENLCCVTTPLFCSRFLSFVSYNICNCSSFTKRFSFCFYLSDKCSANRQVNYTAPRLSLLKLSENKRSVQIFEYQQLSAFNVNSALLRWVEMLTHQSFVPSIEWKPIFPCLHGQCYFQFCWTSDRLCFLELSQFWHFFSLFDDSDFNHSNHTIFFCFDCNGNGSHLG